jgi:hypothetical protein
MISTARLLFVLTSLLLLSIPLAAEDPPAHHLPSLLGPAAPDELPPSFGYRSGSNKLSMDSQHNATLELTGGAEVTYEKIKILADAINTAQSLFPNTKFSILDQGRLSSGPKGPTPSTVSIDTRSSVLPRVGFRGLLTPESAFISRLPVDPAHPLQARFQVILSHLGEFSGLMRRGKVWWPFEGWADRALITVVADVSSHGLGVPRMEQLILLGSPDPNAQRADIKRMALPSSAVASGNASKIALAETKAMKLTFNFAPDGQMKDALEDGDPETTGEMVPSEKDDAPDATPPAK